MKNLISKFYHKLGINSSRTKQIAKHIGWSFLFKIGSMVANFLLVPLTLDYLSIESYGIWLTLSSFIGWFSFFDIGLGNGLRNKFAEAKSLGKIEEAQGLVSTAYYTIGSISAFLLVTFFIVNQFIDWTQVFNTGPELKNQLAILMPVLFAFFALQLVAKLITTIYQGDQNHSIQGKVHFYTQALSLFVIWLLTKADNSSLLIFGSIFSELPVLILFGLNIFAFKTTYARFKPKLSLYNKYYLKEITGLGLNFFVIQIATLVLFSTDNFIITKLFSPAEVVPYNISFKYFSIVSMAYTILITPYWSSFTDAFAKKDFEWIKQSVRNVQKIWFLIPFALVVMVFLADWFYEVWLGSNEVVVPMELSISMAVFVLLLTFNMIYINFINGVGKIRLQLVISVISMVINIPLSIYFGRYLDWGTTGVILATIFCLVYPVMLWPIQYHKMVNGKATGIWYQ